MSNKELHMIEEVLNAKRKYIFRHKESMLDSGNNIMAEILNAKLEEIDFTIKCLKGLLQSFIMNGLGR